MYTPITHMGKITKRNMIDFKSIPRNMQHSLVMPKPRSDSCLDTRKKQKSIADQLMSCILMSCINKNQFKQLDQSNSRK